MTLRSLINPSTDWLDRISAKRAGWVALIACGGLMFYGFSVGYWRSPVMGVYVAIKFPLLIVCTLVCNGLLNGLTGMLLGSGLGFRQSFFALLSSFALAALILGSLAPVMFLFAMNAPPPGVKNDEISYDLYVVAHALLIAFAGISANIHLHRMLGNKAPNRTAATATLLAWLTGNGFLGAQFSWILRPFFGTPWHKIAFLRHDAMRGNFYLSVWKLLKNQTGGNPLPLLFILILGISIPVYLAIKPKQKTKRP